VSQDFFKLPPGTLIRAMKMLKYSFELNIHASDLLDPEEESQHPAGGQTAESVSYLNNLNMPANLKPY
jgi:hypothetical protein